MVGAARIFIAPLLGTNLDVPYHFPRYTPRLLLLKTAPPLPVVTAQDLGASR